MMLFIVAPQMLFRPPADFTPPPLAPRRRKLSAKKKVH